MKDKGKMLALSVESALTSHIVSGSYSDKNEIIKQASKLPGIKSLKILRNKSLLKQFNYSQSEYSANTNDNISQTVFESGIEQYVLPKPYEIPPLLRVSYPYIASSHGNINCLECHQAEEGDVLAVLDFSVDMKNYLTISLTQMSILFVIFIFSFIAIITFFIRVLDINVKKPLEQLVEESTSSYHEHIDIDINRFESSELDYVAHNINQFNKIILKQNNNLQSMNDEIEATQKEIIHIMGYIGEARSKETANHVVRVAEIAYILAVQLNLPKEECHLIRDASPMHDIGKMGIPDSILHKPGKLTHEEHVMMQQHSVWGYLIFKNSERSLLKAVSIIAYQHHERWDGKGYPQGLKEEDIHIYGQITAVADVFDALASKRCYKEAWPINKVKDYFQENRSSQFSPKVVDALMVKFEDIAKIIETYND